MLKSTYVKMALPQESSHLVSVTLVIYFFFFFTFKVYFFSDPLSNYQEFLVVLYFLIIKIFFMCKLEPLEENLSIRPLVHPLVCLAVHFLVHP
jgi:hypothetical protein